MGEASAGPGAARPEAARFVALDGLRFVAALVVVAVHAGAFLLRRLARRGNGLWLVASDGTSPPLVLVSDEGSGGDASGSSNGGGADLWGVVIHAVHHLAGAPSRRR